MNASNSNTHAARWNNMDILSRTHASTGIQLTVEFNGEVYMVLGVESPNHIEMYEAVAKKINSGEAQLYTNWFAANNG